MRQKKIMLLGGIHYLLPAIEAAHKQGYYVITADYLPHNVAHKYSDEYINVSIIDKEAVLQAARDKHIDGILSFAVDPGVTTAAYVQEQMGLPSMGPYESVRILQNKAQFRNFLRDNGFNVPWSESYSDIKQAMLHTHQLPFPVIVKPTDSAGSKGVTKVENLNDYLPALQCAFEQSFSHQVIVEQFIDAYGCSSDSDCLSVDGKLKVVTFSSQYFDLSAANPFTPAAFSWPSTFSIQQQQYLSAELQRLISLLGMKTTLYNVESRIGKDGKPYLMEVSPRAGGNRLAEMIRYATGVDIITAAIRAAVGDRIEDLDKIEYKKNIAYIVLHAPKQGYFSGIDINEDFYNKHQLEPLDIWVQKGEKVDAFTGSNNTIGTLPLQFNSNSEIIHFLNDMNNLIKINVDVNPIIDVSTIAPPYVSY